MIKETHSEKLEQLLFKEKRIITSKILSNELGVHVNEARRILTNFFDHQKETLLHSYHLIVGTIDSEESKAIVFKIVTHDEIEDAKKDLTTLTGCHVYSLSTDKYDKNEIYSVERDYLSANEIKLNTSIKHPAIQIRQPVLIKANGVKIEAKVVPSKKHSSANLSNGSSAPTKTSIDRSLKKEDPESVSVQQNGSGPSENSSKTSPEKVQKTNPLMAMWQKSENKPKSTKNDSSKSNSKKKTPPQAKNNIMSMFSKQTQKITENPVKPAPPKEVPKIHKTEVEPLPKPVKETVKSDKEEKKSATVSKKRRSSQKESKSTKKQDKDSSDEEHQSKKKKRRRICTFDSDSDSESEEAQDRAQRDMFLSEEVIMDTDCKKKSSTLQSDDEEVIPPTPPVIVQKGKRKIWKTINKTFEEDGFLVTKEEKVLVSASESDEDPIPKEKSPIKEIAKTKANVARKQASLTSFFTRK